MPEFSACAVCGSTQYSLDNGMYFCDTCGTALNVSHSEECLLICSLGLNEHSSKSHSVFKNVFREFLYE